MPDLTVDEPPVPLHVHTPSVSSKLPHVHTPSLSSEPLHVHTPSDEPPVLLHVHTPSVSSDWLHVRTPSKLFPGHTPSSSIPPACSDETMSAAQILADLADGGGEQPEPTEPEQEEQEIDIDLLVSGVQRPAAI